MVSTVLDPCHVEQPPRSNAGVGIMVFIRKIDDFPDAALNDGLGALVAGEQRHIHPRTAQIAVSTVQNGVQLRMADVHVFGFQLVTFAVPRHIVIIAADGHAVVAKGKDLVFRADNAGLHFLCLLLLLHHKPYRTG